MNVDRPTATTFLRWATTGLIVLVALPFVLYAVVQFVPGAGGYVVLSDSMAPEYRAGDVVFVQTVGAEAVEEGDVIIYHAPDSRQHVTHQVVDVVDEDDRRLLQTKGTANEEPDPYLVPPGALIGVVVFHVPYLGQAITFLQTDLGIVAFVLVPLGLLVVTEIWSLVAAMRGSNRTGETGTAGTGSSSEDAGSTDVDPADGRADGPSSEHPREGRQGS